MRMMRLGYRGLAGVLLAVGCSSTLMNQPVHSEARGWEVTVREVSDGPNSLNVEARRYVPADGDRFIHVFLTLKNTSGAKREWNWPRCDLDHGSDSVLPTLDLYDTLILAPVGAVESVDAGDMIERRIVFAFPEAGPLPTRLRCADVVVPLALKAG